MGTARILDINGARDFLRLEPGGTLVNVLTPEQHARRHIPGSKQACVFETVFLDNMAGLLASRDAPVLLYGAGDSQDVSIAADKLAEAGYTRVYIFSGGIQAWRDAGFPLEGEAPEADDPPYPPALPAFKQYTLLPEKSRLAWVGRADSHQHWGSLGLISGELSFKGMLGAGKLVADMKAIQCDDLAQDKNLHGVLVAHLCSEDFFLTRLFPEAVMEITDLRPLGGAAAGPGGAGAISGAFAALPNYYGRGLVKIRNRQDFIEGELSVRNLDGGMLSLGGQVRLDRTKWGVIYGSTRFFRFLGGHKVDDMISLDAMLIFQGAGEKNSV